MVRLSGESVPHTNGNLLYELVPLADQTMLKICTMDLTLVEPPKLTNYTMVFSATAIAICNASILCYIVVSSMVTEVVIVDFGEGKPTTVGRKNKKGSRR